MAPQILVIGSLNMDLSARVSRVPGPGETVIGQSYQWIPGGKGANQAVAAARLGADVSICGRVGTDDHGEQLAASLEKDGVSTQFITIDDIAATGLAIISVDNKGENRIIVMPGANERLTMREIETALESPWDAILLQLEVPLEIVYRTIKLAEHRHIRTILDAGPIRSLFLSRLQGLYILSANVQETEALVGIAPTNWQLAKEAAKRLLDASGAQHVVLKMGERGSYWMGDGMESGFGFTTHPVKAIDTTAAGDCFMAAMTVKLIETNEFVPSIKYANTAAALSTTRVGAQPSLPNAVEVQDFIASMSNTK